MNTETMMQPIEVLLVEDNPGDAQRFKENLSGADASQFDVTCVGHLFDTIKCLERDRYDIVMLDHTLPDSHGFETFISVRMHAPKVPIILLANASDEDLAVRALQNGAQDCLIKGKLDGGALIRSIRYAIERHRIMAELENARKKEYHLAYFDSLTSLPNRQLFYDRLYQALSRADRYHEKIALMFIDLDGFKLVNDSMGHDCGDRLLQAVARRLEQCLRKSDTVARFGGDEFTCILPNIKNSRNVSVVAQKIIRSLASTFEIEGKKVYISGSVGASLYPDDTMDINALIKNADVAMYSAKRQGKNNFQFFSGEGELVPEPVSIKNSTPHTVKHRRSDRARHQLLHGARRSLRLLDIH